MKFQQQIYGILRDCPDLNLNGALFRLVSYKFLPGL